MLVAPGAIGYAPELDQRLPYDPEAAKTLLAAAGYPGGFSVTLDCPNNRWINDEAVCRAIAAQLGEIALDVTANPQPKHLFFAKVDNRETDFFFDSWAAMDSKLFFINYYRTGTQGAPGYSNPGVDDFIAKIDREMITYARDAMIEEVWKIVLNDIVYIPLHHQLIVWAMRDSLEMPVFPSISRCSATPGSLLQAASE